MRLCIYVLSYQLSYILSYLLHFLSIHKLLVYPPYQLQNISDITEGVHWVQLHHSREKSRPFQKKCKNKIFHLVLPHFKAKHADFDGLPK